MFYASAHIRELEGTLLTSAEKKVSWGAKRVVMGQRRGVSEGRRKFHNHPQEPHAVEGVPVDVNSVMY
jgi:hypothetical protein